MHSQDPRGVKEAVYLEWLIVALGIFGGIVLNFKFSSFYDGIDWVLNAGAINKRYSDKHGYTVVDVAVVVYTGYFILLLALSILLTKAVSSRNATYCKVWYISNIVLCVFNIIVGILGITFGHFPIAFYAILTLFLRIVNIWTILLLARSLMKTNQTMENTRIL